MKKDTLYVRLGMLKDDKVLIKYIDNNKIIKQLIDEEELYKEITEHSFFNNKIESSFVTKTYDSAGNKETSRIYSFNVPKKQIQISVPLDRKGYCLGLNDQIVAKIVLKTIYENSDIVRISKNKDQIIRSIKNIKDKVNNYEYFEPDLKNLLVILSNEPNRLLLKRIITNMHNYKSEDGKTINDIEIFFEALVGLKKEARVVFNRRFKKIAATVVLVAGFLGVFKVGSDNLEKLNQSEQQQMKDYLDTHPASLESVEAHDYTVSSEEISKIR